MAKMKKKNTNKKSILELRKNLRKALKCLDDDIAKLEGYKQEPKKIDLDIAKIKQWQSLGEELMSRHAEAMKIKKNDKLNKNQCEWIKKTLNENRDKIYEAYTKEEVFIKGPNFNKAFPMKNYNSGETRKAHLRKNEKDFNELLKKILEDFEEYKELCE